MPPGERERDEIGIRIGRLNLNPRTNKKSGARRKRGRWVMKEIAGNKKPPKNGGGESREVFSRMGPLFHEG